MADFPDVVVYGGVYEDEALAHQDYGMLKELHKQKLIGRHQGAVFTKQSDGKVKVLDTTSTTRSTGAKWGAAIGAVVGLVFPPGLLLSTAGGAALGATLGTLGKGWSGGQVKQLADELNPGESGIVVVAEATADLTAAAVLANAVRTGAEPVSAEDAAAISAELEKEDEEAGAE